MTYEERIYALSIGAAETLKALHLNEKQIGRLIRLKVTPVIDKVFENLVLEISDEIVSELSKSSKSKKEKKLWLQTFLVEKLDAVKTFNNYNI